MAQIKALLQVFSRLIWTAQPQLRAPCVQDRCSLTNGTQAVLRRHSAAMAEKKGAKRFGITFKPKTSLSG